MPYATVSDVSIDFEVIPDADIDKVETLLERAEARILQDFPDLAARMSGGRTSLVLVKQVESEMVAAVLRNPNGTKNSYSQEMVGPFSRQLQSTLDSALASGILELTARHRVLLGERPMPGIYSVPLGAA